MATASSRIGSTASSSEQLDTAVAAARACSAPISVITNRPDGGVVFNNAMTSADAGSIDRGQAVIDAVAAHTDAFRCCFDAWFRNHDGREARVMLKVELAPDGTVANTTTDPERSTASDEVVLGCVAAVAGDITYPTSPSGQATMVEYPLVAQPSGANDEGSKPR